MMLPEIILIIFTLLILFLKDRPNLVFWSSVAGIILSIIAVPLAQDGAAFFDTFVSNGFIDIFRFLILSGTLVTLFIAKNSIKGTGEFYFLLLVATFGALLLSGANDLIMLAVALETLGIASFALAGYAKNNKLSNEAALKYLVFGAVSTGVMLYGFSFIYGITGETNFEPLANKLSGYEVNSILVTGFLMTLAGFGFKIAAVPFQAWAPDVYEGAPLPVAAYLSVVSKAAGLAVLIRFVGMLFPETELFGVIIGVIAAITMTVGNLMALSQQNIRRLMGYSSIAHAGYLLAGLAIMSNSGVTAIMFYLITYLFMTFGVWAAVEIFSMLTGKENIDDYTGLSYKHRYYSLGLAICLLSLAGIPITAGFFSKFFLFMTIAVAGYEYMPLLIIALVNTVIALFYYVRVIKALYVKPRTEMQAVDINASPLSLRAVLAVTAAGVVFVGVFASPFIEFILRST